MCLATNPHAHQRKFRMPAGAVDGALKITYVGVMRWFFRIFLFWLVSATLAYVWGVPYLLDYLGKKARNEQYIACMKQVLTLPEHQRTTNAIADYYCTCLNKGLIFVKADLLEMLQTRALPKALQERTQERITTCQPALQGKPIQPDRTPVRNPDGSTEFYL